MPPLESRASAVTLLPTRPSAVVNVLQTRRERDAPAMVANHSAPVESSTRR
jgi:hypothetical protein